MKSKKKVTALEQAYKKTKVLELENIVESILAESTSLSLLLENPEEFADLSEKIATFEQIAESSKTLTPNLSKFILENCKNIFESVKQPELLENSLNGLAVASKLLRSQSPSSTFEWFIEAPNDVCEDISKLSEKQLHAFRNHVPQLQKILTDNQIKLKAKILREAQSTQNEPIDLNAISNSVSSIRQIISSLPVGFKKTKAGFEKYMSQFKKAAALYGNDPKNQEKVKQLGAQAQKVIALLPSIAKIWPQISNIFQDEFQHLSGQQNNNFGAAAKDTAQTVGAGLKKAGEWGLEKAASGLDRVKDQIAQRLEEGGWAEANKIRKMKSQIKAAIAGQVQYSRGLILLKQYPGVQYPNEINPDIVIEDIFAILLEPDDDTASETKPATTNESLKIKNNFFLLKEGLQTLNVQMQALSNVGKQVANVSDNLNNAIKAKEETTTAAEQPPEVQQGQQGKVQPPAVEPAANNTAKQSQDPLKALALGILANNNVEQQKIAAISLKKTFKDLEINHTTLNDLSGEIARLFQQNLAFAKAKSDQSPKNVVTNADTAPQTSE